MGYRADYFKANKGINGRHQCVCCKGWFTQKEVDIDHIVPQNRGGTDDLWNLQVMCKHCNRSKQDTMDTMGVDLARSMVKNVVQGNGIDNIGGAVGSFVMKNASNSIQEALGIKKPRKRRRNG